MDTEVRLNGDINKDMASNKNESMNNKITYHHGSLKEALIDEALLFLTNNSFEDLSLRKLATKIGVNQTAIYSHFKNKNSLLGELARHGFNQLISQSHQIYQQGHTTDENLSLFVAYYLDFARENPEKFKLMFGHIFSELHPDSPNLWETAEESLSLFQAVIEDYLKSIGSHEQPHLATLTVWSFMHGFGHLVIGDRLSADTVAALDNDKLLDQLLNIIKRGLHTS